MTSTALLYDCYHPIHEDDDDAFARVGWQASAFSPRGIFARMGTQFLRGQFHRALREQATRYDRVRDAAIMYAAMVRREVIAEAALRCIEETE